jgi:soluble cytochrome b562
MDLPSTDGKEEEDPQFTELQGEFMRKHRAGQFEAGKILQQMSEERIFGPWKTFRNLMEGGLRSTEQRGYQLINGYKNYVLLKEAGCPLPINENQVRPLRLLKKEPMRIKAWTRAVAQKQTGQPTGEDVQREVSKILHAKSSKSTDDASCKYRQCFEVIRAQLVKADMIREQGDLEEFLLCSDKTSNHRKKAIAELMVFDGIRLGDHFKKFEPFLDEPPEED